ncbi:hypothetical protein PENSPDRAFT_695064 [Peniophora sp. CONT]|nr:hypothetical protein PENSPDRAFT_695064 [Peniophora sp. CONT]
MAMQMAAAAPSDGAESSFKNATPFPTDLPTDSLFKAAVRLSNAISAREALLASLGMPDLPISPLTASSAGTPELSGHAVPAPDEVAAALERMLEEMDNLRVAPEFTDSGLSSGARESGGDEDDGAAASSPAYSDPERGTGLASESGGASMPRKRKRKRTSQNCKVGLHNNGQDGVPNRKKEYQRKKRRKKRQQERFDAANGAPYERRHRKEFYKRTHCVRLLNLKTFEVKYATGPGGYIGKKKFGRRLYSVSQLLEMGFKELPWNGDDTIVILDRENRIVCVLIGPPQGMTPEQRAEWDAGMRSLAEAYEEERKLHEGGFGKNLRGGFDAFATGFTMGPGAKVFLPFSCRKTGQ